jgi:hypothetical protein
MPVNTESALSNARPNSSNSNLRGRNLRAAQLRWDRENTSRQTAEVTNITPEVVTGSVGYSAGQVDPRLAAAAQTASSAASAFTVGYEAGQVDPRLAAAVADRTTDTPSPSTIQATNAAPAGTTPSLAARQNTTFSNISPRPYFRIDPLDNRYDFLTGQKVNTTGGQPNVNTPVDYTGGNTSGGTGVGGNPGTSEIPIGYGEGQIDPALAEAAGLEGNVAEIEAAEQATTAAAQENIVTTGRTYDSRISAEIGARREGWPRSQLRTVVIDNGDGSFSVLSKD